VKLIGIAESDKFLIFLLFLISGLALLLGLIISYLFPDKRIWPPPKKGSWQFWYVWILATLSYLGLVLTGIIDYGSLGYDQIILIVIGLPLLVGGLIFGFWGVRTLSTHQSLGLEGKLVKNGPYRYTRNPQYIGEIIAIIGFILVSNSLLSFFLGIIGILWFVFAPFTEEPWLIQVYGEEYKEFSEQTPRFLSLKSFRRN
jgi:protein-S-isoprenylcysteine O-methyltransferase Ste14